MIIAGLNASQQTYYLSLSGFEVYGTVTRVYVDEFPQTAGAEMQPRKVTAASGSTSGTAASARAEAPFTASAVDLKSLSQSALRAMRTRR